MADVTSAWNIAWVQPDGPGTVPRMLTCYALDSITVPKGSWARQQCWDPVTNEWVTEGMTQDPPDMASATLEGLTRESADFLEKTLRKNCPVYVYVNATKCPPRGAFGGFDRGKVMKAARVESEEESGLLARDTQEQSLESYDFVIDGVEKYFSADAYRRTLSQTEEATDVMFLGGPTCAGDCGPEIERCEIGYLALQALGAATADYLYTTDGGVTWAVVSADPLAGLINGLNVSSTGAFSLGGNRWRIFAAQGTTSAGVAPVIAYADVDIIATPGTTVWTQVTPTSIPVADYFPYNGSLCVLDQYHIWAGTDNGDIFFSDDGGLTYTLQYTDSTNDDIRCIRFLNKDFGVYVGGATGASNVMGYTEDGGLNWTEVTITGIGATAMINSVAIHTESSWTVADEDGAIWKTWDKGQTAFTQMPQPPVAGLTAWGDISELMAIDECCIWASAEATIGGNSIGLIMRTIDGGYDWDVWQTASGDGTLGMQTIWACSYNEAIAAGDTATTTQVYEVTD